MSERDQLLTAYMDFLESGTHDAALRFYITLLPLVDNPGELHRVMKFVHLNETGWPVTGSVFLEQLDRDAMRAAASAWLQRKREGSENEDNPLDLKPIQRKDPKTMLDEVSDFLTEAKAPQYLISIMPELISLAAEWARRSLLTDPSLYHLTHDQQEQIQAAVNDALTKDQAMVDMSTMISTQEKRESMEIDTILEHENFFKDSKTRLRIYSTLLKTIIDILQPEENKVLIKRILLLYNQQTHSNVESLQDIHRILIGYEESLAEPDTRDDVATSETAEKSRLPIEEFVTIQEFLKQLAVWFADFVPPKANKS